MVKEMAQRLRDCEIHTSPVISRDLGGHVDRRRGGQHEVLCGLVVALLAADHQVVEELPVLEEVVRLVVLGQNSFEMIFPGVIYRVSPT